MVWRGTQTEGGEGQKCVQVWDEPGELIYSATVDSDTVFSGPVEWGEA
jgi:hypothetical protein